ncbi:hypothetical protein MMC17_003195, partial [Xylographa soralifera]|nr:hypothetical protein [Xylographa soralifera]
SDHLRNEPIYTSSQIPITTSSGIHGPIIGEWVIMTSLVASHRYSILHEWQKAQSWEDSPSAKAHFASVTDNVGKRLGILGYGSIGRQVARYAQVMGMDVVAFTANPRNGPESRRDHGYVVPGTGDPEGEIPSAWFSGLDKKSLHEFLSYDLDQLLVCVPLTQQTKHLLGKEEFDILSKKNAFVTNIARGEILVQEALIDALKDFENSSFSPGEGKKGLRGAALDVATPEPLPKDHPLWTAPNCIITPHMSGINHNYSTRALQVVEKNLERLAKGERLLNLVNRETGYASKLA